MQKNSNSFSMGDAMQMANSPAGKQLLAMLQSQDPQVLQQAMAKAKAGDYQAAKQMLEQITKNERAQKLIHQMEQQHG